MRMFPLLMSALLASAAASAQGDSSVSSISEIDQLLPEQAIDWLDGVQRARGASSLSDLVLRDERKLKVLLNPVLRGEGDGPLPASAFVLPGGARPSVELVAALGERRRGDSSLLHTKLGLLIDAFLSLPSVLDHSSEPVESLGACIDRDGSGNPLPNFVVLAVDAQVAGVDGGEQDALEVQLTLRLFRVEVDHRRPEPPDTIERLELLWSDRGTGRATLRKGARPARGGWDDWTASERDVFRDAARDAFGVAVIAALRSGPAVNLWANPRTLEASWFGDRTTSIGASLHDVKEVH